MEVRRVEVVAMKVKGTVLLGQRGKDGLTLFFVDLYDLNPQPRVTGDLVLVSISDVLPAPVVPATALLLTSTFFCRTGSGGVSCRSNRRGRRGRGGRRRRRWRRNSSSSSSSPEGTCCTSVYEDLRFVLLLLLLVSPLVGTEASRHCRGGRCGRRDVPRLRQTSDLASSLSLARAGSLESVL